jgi:hypothetical protein
MRSTAGVWVGVMYQIGNKVWTRLSLHLNRLRGGRAGTAHRLRNGGQCIRSTAVAAVTLCG